MAYELDDDDDTFEFALTSILKYDSSKEAMDDEMSKYMELMFAFSKQTHYINKLNAHNNGQVIGTLIDIIINEVNTNESNTSTLSKCIIFLGRILSCSPNKVYLSQFINHGGTELIYNKILTSSMYNFDEDVVYSLVNFLYCLHQNDRIDHKQIVLNNTEYQFIFQIALILSKNLNFDDAMNLFCKLLHNLYSAQNIKTVHGDSDEDDDDDDDDENNIKSILNTLIFTGFVTTISKRTAMIDSGTNHKKKIFLFL